MAKKLSKAEKEAQKKINKLHWELVNKWTAVAKINSICMTKQSIGPNLACVSSKEFEFLTKHHKKPQLAKDLYFCILLGEKKLGGTEYFLYRFNPFEMRLELDKGRIPLEKVDKGMEFVPLFTLERDKVEFGMRCYAYLLKKGNRCLVKTKLENLERDEVDYLQIFRKMKPLIDDESHQSSVQKTIRSIILKKFKDFDQDAPRGEVRFLPLLQVDNITGLCSLIWQT